MYQTRLNRAANFAKLGCEGWLLPAGLGGPRADVAFQPNLVASPEGLRVPDLPSEALWEGSLVGTCTMALQLNKELLSHGLEDAAQKDGHDEDRGDASGYEHTRPELVHPTNSHHQVNERGQGQGPKYNAWERHQGHPEVPAVPLAFLVGLINHVVGTLDERVPLWRVHECLPEVLWELLCEARLAIVILWPHLQNHTPRGLQRHLHHSLARLKPVSHESPVYVCTAAGRLLEGLQLLSSPD
mmetsp:Transcript_40431/g.114501  ORF Transcript_40431/g.114501 Transcript_40431/m.114501 type:complete len:242 (-) Transcript_40431:376-1101(-)